MNVKRELNIVLHNVPGSTASDGSTRKQEDIAQINSILNEYVDVKPTIHHLNKRRIRPSEHNLQK